MIDASGQSLAYVYGHANKRDAGIAKALTLDEARRIAANIAKLPTLLSEGGLSVGFGRPSRFNSLGAAHPAFPKEARQQVLAQPFCLTSATLALSWSKRSSGAPGITLSPIRNRGVPFKSSF